MRRPILMLPGPTMVPDRVLKAMSRPLIGHRTEEFRRLYAEVVSKLKKVFQTEGKVLVLTSSGTGGVEAAVASVVRRGDKCIVLVNGVFGERIAETVEAFGGRPVRVSAPVGEVPSLEEVKRAIEENEDAKCVMLVYNETSTGTVNRLLPEIARIARSRGMLTIVDAVSALGGDVLPVDEWGLDIVVTGSQKCLAAPPGLALISLSERAIEAMEGKKPSSFYFNLKRYMEYAERGETPFTPAIPLIYALDEALNMILEEGLERRITRHRACAKALYEALSMLGFKPLPREEWRSVTVIAVRPPNGLASSEIISRLSEEWGIYVANGMGDLKGKIMRIGNMGWVGRREVMLLLTAISTILMEKGVVKASEVVDSMERALEVIGEVA